VNNHLYKFTSAFLKLTLNGQNNIAILIGTEDRDILDGILGEQNTMIGKGGDDVLFGRFGAD
jgi:hypothetical protein